MQDMNRGGVRMALSREKYKRVPDLYVTGKELVLLDGQVMWMQALNPLERDEAQHDAQVANARLVMALKGDHGSEERILVEGSFWSEGRELAIGKLVTAKLNIGLVDVVNGINDDPEWKERLEILRRSDELRHRPAEDAERKLLEDIDDQYVAEFNRRQDDERAYLTSKYTDADEAFLIEEYIQVYIDRRGGEVARGEYELSELWYAVRVCDAIKLSDTEWDHSSCEGHSVHAYITKDEVHSLPEPLQEQMKALMAEINMSVRDSKNSARQGSSSGSSPLPSEAEESTPSTPTEIHAEPPGSSLQPSGTP